MLEFKTFSFPAAAGQTVKLLKTDGADISLPASQTGWRSCWMPLLRVCRHELMVAGFLADDLACIASCAFVGMLACLLVLVFTIVCFMLLVFAYLLACLHCCLRSTLFCIGCLLHATVSAYQA